MLSPHLYHACRKPRRISDANGHLRQVDTKRQPEGTQGRALAGVSAVAVFASLA